MTLVCPFKNVVVSLTQTHWRYLLGLDFEGADLDDSNTFASYDKIDFVKSISKTKLESLN